MSEHLLTGQGETLLVGCYRLLGRLGPVGPNTVYLGEPVDGGGPVAVKVLTLDHRASWAVVERFKAGMEKAGVRCEAVFYEEQGHGFFNGGKKGEDKYFYETLIAADRFLVSLGWLKGEPTLKIPPAP